MAYIQDAIERKDLAGDGRYTHLSRDWLQTHLHVKKSLLTASCTAALEMCTLLLDLKPGNEVILPSYTFPSTANAICLRGATPVFVDIRPDTLNIDEKQIADAITPQTRAICPVHYAGVACAMDEILSIAHSHKIDVFEDAAQCLGGKYKGKTLGSLSDLACLSFHATKNVASGEGGALLLNRQDLGERAEILWQKGTNRREFLEGKIDKYTWVDLGSSFLPSELQAAFLYAQLQAADEITKRRQTIWQKYHTELEDAEQHERLRRPGVPSDCEHPAHIYYIILPTERKRDQLMAAMAENGITCVSHFVPLHSSPAGKKFGRNHGSMDVTASMSERILRLPLWPGMENAQTYVIEKLLQNLA